MNDLQFFFGQDLYEQSFRETSREEQRTTTFTAETEGGEEGLYYVTVDEDQAEEATEPIPDNDAAALYTSLSRGALSEDDDYEELMTPAYDVPRPRGIPQTHSCEILYDNTAVTVGAIDYARLAHTYTEESSVYLV